MNNLQTNALRIAELMGYEQSKAEHVLIRHRVGHNKKEILDVFSSYQGLMPIVFECNNSHFSVIQVAHLYRRNYILFVDVNDCTSNDPVYYETEPEFIEAIQLAVIKYLEIKNDNSRVQQTI